jgi:hypothetical protein
VSEANAKSIETAGTERNEVSLFERAIFELIIGALSLLVLYEDKEEVESYVTDKLLEVFMLVSYNPLFASHKLHSILKSIGALGNPEVEYTVVNPSVDLFNDGCESNSPVVNNEPFL